MVYTEPVCPNMDFYKNHQQIGEKEHLKTDKKSITSKKLEKKTIDPQPFTENF